VRAGWLALLLSGVAAGASGESPAAREAVQLYVMPDTQAWAWNQGGTSLEAWHETTRALCAARERFRMVLHTGDLVDRPRQRPSEWDNAQAVMRTLDGCNLPYALAFGNHDFDNYPAPEGTPLTGDGRWKALRAQLAQQPLEASPSGRSGLFPLAADWVVLVGDFSAGEPDVAWLHAAIEARPGARFVFLNHQCVKQDGIAGERCAAFFERHAAIRVAIGGHWLGRRREGWRRIERAHGPPLVVLYQNYQHVPELAAWGVVVELDVTTGAICVWTENLVSGETERPAVSSPELGPILAGPSRRCFD
jgi:3',5'-cyclic AMP phosphodiesterase CpdA